MTNNLFRRLLVSYYTTSKDAVCTVLGFVIVATFPLMILGKLKDDTYCHIVRWAAIAVFSICVIVTIIRTISFWHGKKPRKDPKLLKIARDQFITYLFLIYGIISHIYDNEGIIFIWAALGFFILSVIVYLPLPEKVRKFAKKYGLEDDLTI